MFAVSETIEVFYESQNQLYTTSHRGLLEVVCHLTTSQLISGFTLVVLMLWRSTFVLLLAHLVAASPLARRWDDIAEKHSWVEIPNGWELHSEAPSTYTFELRIGLKESKMEQLIETLMETSDPAHTRWICLASRDK